ncbi:hypothetical protein OsJ_19364 [Oryza sativa Japonica Group]|uniref:Uncharacterized protein n=1 Tax=Oryza sativa subsp. japonica TaxID=39947 RepID=B9FLC5_ORYSJ|nr:hypothetical protein OsJ_19364 [Oryza sativa Japonica Group]
MGPSSSWVHGRRLGCIGPGPALPPVDAVADIRYVKDTEYPEPAPGCSAAAKNNQFLYTGPPPPRSLVDKTQEQRRAGGRESSCEDEQHHELASVSTTSLLLELG